MASVEGLTDNGLRENMLNWIDVKLAAAVKASEPQDLTQLLKGIRLYARRFKNNHQADG